MFSPLNREMIHFDLRIFFQRCGSTNHLERMLSKIKQTKNITLVQAFKHCTQTQEPYDALRRVRAQLRATAATCVQRWARGGRARKAGTEVDVVGLRRLHLGGGFNLFIFTPRGNDPIWLAHIFSTGWLKKDPPTGSTYLVDVPRKNHVWMLPSLKLTARP